LHAIEHTIFNATPNWGVKNEFSDALKGGMPGCALCAGPGDRILEA